MFGLKALFTSNGPSWPPSSSTAPTMIFGTRMSYLISWQILENKARCPVPEEDWVKGTFTFYSISTKIHKNSSPYHIVKDGISCTPWAGGPLPRRAGRPSLLYTIVWSKCIPYIIYSLSPGCLMLIFSNWLPYSSKSWRLCQSPQTSTRWINCAWDVLIENLCEKFDIIQVCVCTAATDPR